LALLSSLQILAQDLRIAVIRVSFQDDSSPATTGRGQFVLEDVSGITCDQWTLDPPPHDSNYFMDHLIAQDNYWSKVSGGLVGVDTQNSHIFPSGTTESYRLPHDMVYYHPYRGTFDETEKLFELSRDALTLADPDIDFSQFTSVILVHAGMGGDFAFALDPTPGNIPSAYLSDVDFQEYGNLVTAEGSLTDLIIVPESQNFLQYEETRTLFEEAEDPCFYQVGLNGTLALMLGFHLGLPPLYNTESGVSLVGGFALMDQGSNNFHGIAPAYPDPYTRIRMGWTNAVEARVGDDVRIGVNDPPVRVPMSETEYYLLENRQRNLDSLVNVPQWIDGPGFDTVSVILSERGVVLDVDEQHAGLPGNGLYIWHIDESAWFTNSNPNGGPIQLVDFVEADGAQDMGHTTQILFADYLETGWWFDPWFAGNEGYFHLNRNMPVPADSLLTFGTNTRPSTRSNRGYASHISLENISRNGSVMSVSVRSDRIINTEAISHILGWAHPADGIWAFNYDSTQIVKYGPVAGKMAPLGQSGLDSDWISSHTPDNGLVFRHPWLMRNQSSGLQIRHIETNENRLQVGIRDVSELSVTPQYSYYFAEQNGGHVQVNWLPQLGTTQIYPLMGTPIARFQTRTAMVPYYFVDPTYPTPVAVAEAPESGVWEINPAVSEIISWSTSAQALEILNHSTNAVREIFVEMPETIIPIDVELDGVYELALIYTDQVRIINQNGVPYNGSPFFVDSHYGTPLIAPMLDGKTTLFLRHADHYQLYSLEGATLETGVLPLVDGSVVNSIRSTDSGSLLLSDKSILSFEYANAPSSAFFWSDPQGNPEGSRVVRMVERDGAVTSDIKAGTVFNYPNPIKGSSTTIRAWLGDVSTWQIKIFTLSGGQIANEELVVSQPNSYNEWVWDASNISNGVFLAQISAGNKAEIIKIAIIR